jgi:hypothetical protein
MKLEELVAKVDAFIVEPERLKAIAVLGATGGGVYLLRENIPKITESLRRNLPWLSNETVSLSIDTLTNTLTAPIGFLLSNYANDKNTTKKELLGQIAFAFAWGALRHYVYEGLSNFDDINLASASSKVSLYTAYYAAYGALYAAFSEFWSRVCGGASYISAIKGVGNNAKEKLRNLAKDSGIQLNLALNIANMFNPWVESRPTVAGLLLIDYNTNVIKHSHKRVYGFLDYFKKVLRSNDYTNSKGIRTNSAS